MKKWLVIILVLILIINFAIAEEYIVRINKDFEKGIQTLSNSNLLSDIEITYNFSSFNGFTARLTKEQYERLKKDSRFEITNQKRYSIFLDKSIPQIKANDTWVIQHKGINLTGLHQTVCVIDTGIDYNHSNLGGCYGKNNASSKCKIIGGWNFVNNNEYPMDDNGHGTHIAGIILSNDSTYKGVAPDSKIIAIKSLEAGGSGTTENIARGIEWCINNASKFNITVISMSFGAIGIFENEFCSGKDSKVEGNISLAIQNNITVVVAAGNCVDETEKYNESLCHTGISFPACIQGVIPVGAVDSSDNIYYQRGELFQILAPGINIISTKLDGGFETRGGTSMSAPHLAGAVAIINQFYQKEYQRLPTNESIKQILNKTNTWINDTTGNYILYPRLNFFDSIFYLLSNIVTIIEPTNNTFTNQEKINLTCESQSFIELTNITFFVYNSTGLVNEKIINLSGTQNTTTISYNFSEEGVYLWNCLVYNNESQSTQTQNYTLTYDTMPPNLTILEPLPSSEAKNQSTKDFYFNVSDKYDNLNCSLIINDIVNQTKTISEENYNTELNFTKELSEGEYNWKINCTNKIGNNIISQEYSFIIADLVILEKEPANNTFINQEKINLTCESQTIQDKELKNITFFIYNSTGLVNETIEISGTENTTTISYNFSEEGVYLWNCLVYNNESQSTQTQNYTLTYDLTHPNLTILEPLPSSETANSATKHFYFNVSDKFNNLNCSLIINDKIKESKIIDKEDYNTSLNFTKTLTPNTYNWKINCSNLAGNFNVSNTFSFTISQEPSPVSSGRTITVLDDKDSVIGTQKNPITHEHLKESYSFNIYKGSKIYFEDAFKKLHSLTLHDIINKTINITIESEPINLILKENSSAKLNLTEPDFLDLEIIVEKVLITSADIILKDIYEPNLDYVPPTQEEIKTKDSQIENDELEKNFLWLDIFIISFFIIILIILIYFFIMEKIRTMPDKQPKKIKPEKTKKKNEKTKTG